MREREKYENGIFTVRFIGEDLDKHGVSIYDLSQTLLAMQRIVHKAYLAQNERLEKGAFPNKEERESLALQLGERRRASDAFALIPLLTDPTVQTTIKQVADYVISGIVGYFVGDVIDRARKEPDGEKQIFIGSIYGEVVNIASYSVKAGDTVAVREKAKKQLRVTDSVKLAEAQGMPGWVQVDANKLEGVFKKAPDRDEFGADIKEALIVELYSR